MSLVLPVFTGRFFDESEAGFSYLSGRVQEIAHCRCLNHRYLAHCRCFTAERNPKRRKCDELYHCLSQIRDGTCQAQVSLYTICDNKVYTAWCGPCLSIAGILRMPVAKFMQIMQGLHIDWVIWVYFSDVPSYFFRGSNLQEPPGAECVCLMPALYTACHCNRHRSDEHRLLRGHLEQ